MKATNNSCAVKSPVRSSKSDSRPEKGNLSRQDTKHTHQAKCQKKGQAFTEPNKINKKEPCSRTKSRKYSKEKLGRNDTIKDKPLYSKEMKPDALKQRQECGENIRWTTHPTYKREYKENRTKRKKTLDKKKCNINIKIYRTVIIRIHND